MRKVIQGVNDLYTWCMDNDKGRLILEQWTGLSESNSILDIHKTSIQSNKRVLWKCKEGHEWYTTIQKRTLLDSGCPYCNGQRVISGKNDLYTWCKENGRESLIEEYVGEDEQGNSVSMKRLSRATSLKVKWRHTNGNGEQHEWIARVSDRTSKRSGCPTCNGKNTNIPGKNDLKTWCLNNRDFGSILEDQWVGATEDNELLNMEDISYGSKTRVFWECECNRVWLATSLSRINHKSTVCPTCSRINGANKRINNMVTSGGSIADWCKANGITGQMIKEQFAGMDECGDVVTLESMTYGSNKKVLWQHLNENGELHEWFATVHNRVCNGSLCPLCNNKGTSLNEQIIYNCFKQIYPNTLSRQKFNGYEYDIAIPDLKLCVEYGSEYYHTEKRERDREKERMCNKHNVNFISITDTNYKESISEWTESSIVDRFRSRQKMRKLLDYIFKLYNVDDTKLDYDKAVIDAIRFMSN